MSLPRVLAGIAAFVLGAGAAAGAGCGSTKGLIPSDRASALTRQADAVRAAVDRRDCAAAQTAARHFSTSVDTLADAGVDARLRSRLRSGAARLALEAGAQCNDPGPRTSTPSTPAPTVTPTTQTGAQPPATSTATPPPPASTTTPAPPPPVTTPADPGAGSTPTPPADPGTGGATGDGTGGTG